MTDNWSIFLSALKKRYSKRVWIPIGLGRSEEVGKYPEIGHQDRYEGVRSLVVPLHLREEGEQFEWSSDWEHQHWAGKGVYKPAEAYWLDDEGTQLGVRLALRQTFPDREPIWHLNQDFVIALGLAYEAGTWLRPAENYVEVARKITDANGSEVGIEVRSEYLIDYLCARSSALRIVTFRSLNRITPIASEVRLEFGDETELSFEDGKLQKFSVPLDHSGNLANSGVAVFRASRNDVDPDDDVPEMGNETPHNTDTESWTFERPDADRMRFAMEFWRDEWLEPGPYSPRVRYDEPPSAVTFVVSADGSRMSADELNDEDIGRWLWFKPDVIMHLSTRRGATLRWFSRDTGGISTPSDPSVHFGLNEINLVTVYARDIARLPEWERRFWAGYNLTPDGKVSSELLMSQVQAKPANTQSPEYFLPIVLAQFDDAWFRRFDRNILRKHESTEEIAARSHRFRALDRNGLFALAKDLARLTADLIDASEAQKVSAAPAGQKTGSLKSLENALARLSNKELARSVMGPLQGVYQLRLADAHLPKSDVIDAFDLLKIEEDASPIAAGYQMLRMTVSSIDACRTIVERAST